MLHSYVGIANRQGLQSLWPEYEHTAEFLCRWAARQADPRTVCFWAILDATLADQISLELDYGNRGDACILLQSFAADIGRIVPSRAPKWVACAD